MKKHKDTKIGTNRNLRTFEDGDYFNIFYGNNWDFSVEWDSDGYFGPQWRIEFCVYPDHKDPSSRKNLVGHGKTRKEAFADFRKKLIGIRLMADLTKNIKL